MITIRYIFTWFCSVFVAVSNNNYLHSFGLSASPIPHLARLSLDRLSMGESASLSSPSPCSVRGCGSVRRPGMRSPSHVRAVLVWVCAWCARVCGGARALLAKVESQVNFFFALRLLVGDRSWGTFGLT